MEQKDSISDELNFTKTLYSVVLEINQFHTYM